MGLADAKEAAARGHEELHFERHSIWIEPPDTVHLTWRGDFSGKAMDWFFDEIRRVGRTSPVVFVTVDQRQQGALTAAARQRAAAGAPEFQHITRVVACFGMSPQIRVLINLVMKARSLIKRNETSREHVRFFDTEAEALAWLAEQRASHGPSRGEKK
jgi:hypothetical protein